MRTIYTSITTACVALLIASSASAQFFLYEGFQTPGDYTDGANINGQSGGTGDWAANWTDLDPQSGSSGVFLTEDTSLNYTEGLNQLDTTAGSLQKSTSLHTQYSRQFDNAAFNTSFGNGEDVWFSVLFSANTSSRFYFSIDNDGGASAGTPGGPGFRQQTAGGNLQAQFNNSLSASVTYNADQTYFILGRITQGEDGVVNDVLDVWIDPVLGGSLGAADLTSSNDYNMSFSEYINIRSNSSNAIIFDEIRVGVSQAAVTPYTAVPEPGVCAALLGVLALGVAHFRRKRA